MTDIRLIPAEELAMNWVYIKPVIDRALEHGVHETSSHDIFVGAMNGNYHIWEIAVDGEVRSFAATRFNSFSQHKQLQVVTTAGDGWDDYGPDALKHIEREALLMGCKYVTIWGRPGWVRKMKPYGYNHVYSVVMKEV